MIAAHVNVDDVVPALDGEAFVDTTAKRAEVLADRLIYLRRR